MNTVAYTKGTVGAASYALENVSNDLAEKGVHGVKVICCWSMTDFPAAPTPHPHSPRRGLCNFGRFC